jgi:molybdenum cofactor cytidylyltransferase
VLTRPDLVALSAAGVAEVSVARLEPGDVGEAEAAARLARNLVPDEGPAGLRLSVPVNGRVNLHATRAGVLGVDAGAVLRLNLIDPALTLATLMPFARVAPGTMAGTVKIISYAVAGAALDAACAVAAGAMRVHPVVVADAGLILTDAPGQDGRLIEKGRAAVVKRLRALGMTLAEVRVVPHEAGALTAAVGAVRGGMILILTGAATSDLHDVAPEAVRRARGTVARFGMPVDPGNLLFYGALGGRPVIGLPGCARSPALNGADWVLERLACGIAVTDDDIAAMGVGGLLKEIPIRPQPRERGGE